MIPGKRYFAVSLRDGCVWLDFPKPPFVVRAVKKLPSPLVFFKSSGPTKTLEIGLIKERKSHKINSLNQSAKRWLRNRSDWGMARILPAPGRFKTFLLPAGFPPSSSAMVEEWGGVGRRFQKKTALGTASEHMEAHSCSSDTMTVLGRAVTSWWHPELELLENEFTGNSGTLWAEELWTQAVLRAALGRTGLGAGGEELDMPQEAPELGLRILS